MSNPTGVPASDHHLIQEGIDVEQRGPGGRVHIVVRVGGAGDAGGGDVGHVV